MSSSPGAHLQDSMPRSRASWELDEGLMPESVVHDHAVELLMAILRAWARSSGARFVARNMAVRWDASRPQVGVDPDVCVISPPPPGADAATSVRTWVEGNAAPLLAIEVVSENNPRKDYALGPEKYEASGTQELVIFDPLLCGPNIHGGPHRLQVWERGPEGTFARSYAGDGPAYSAALSGHLVVRGSGKELRFADDAAGERLWLTTAEAALAREEAERVAKEAALARVAELEAELARRR